ncbi:type II toxin-antitoxin system RelE/ParE family toxin [Sediminibacterium ginsengisoli]|uniref:Toxin n=1 Tax=Sediminibacterium ginsengisoli TaxID=413434 RepID=A0A1T4JXZ6_9BACT|nr:type II toxin-antitoxin system RelE/ParE family toxin [Sediminibacterium ginsengisoli]SJZ34998.1 toxin ParE1/3/4 [Sediminibacterium ginsengisoli]
MGHKLSVEAANDLKNIWLYTFETWSLEQADRYINLIFDEIEYLSDNPKSGKDFSHLRDKYRCSKVKSHLIFYRQISATDIEIIRILHQRMDIESRLTE